MVVPSNDPTNPSAPKPDQPTLDAIANYLDARRLVTTQLFLRPPVYVGIWVSVGITVVAGQSIADVTAAVKSALKGYLAPIDPNAPPWYEGEVTSPDNPYAQSSRGWPLQKPVNPLELQAVASRVDGVDLVQPVLVALSSGGVMSEIPMTGLQLPQVLGISVVSGQPTDIGALQGAGPGGGGPGGTGPGAGPPLIPIPVIPDTC